MAKSTDEFAADAGKRLKQELSQVAEGDRVLASDAPLREEAKDLGNGGVDGGGGREIAAEGFDLGGLEGQAEGRLWRRQGMRAWKHGERRAMRGAFRIGGHRKR